MVRCPAIGQGMVAYAYLRSKGRHHGATVKAEAAKGLRCCEKTARKVLKALIRVGLVEADNRRFKALSPTVVWPSKSGKNRSLVDGKNGLLVAAESGKNGSLSTNHSSSEKDLVRTREAALASPGLGAATLAAAHEDNTPALALFAASSNGAVEILAVEDVAPERVAAVAAVASDKELASYIRTATGNRVADAGLSPSGLRIVRQWAGTLVSDAKTPTAALNTVLRAIYVRVGCRGGKLFASGGRQ